MRHLDNQSRSVSTSIDYGFRRLWHNSITFDKAIEIKGFQLTAESTFNAVQYSIGVAVLALGDITNAKIALNLFNELHSNLSFSKIKPPPPKLLEIKRKIKELKALAEWIVAKLLLQNQEGNIAEAERYLMDSIQTFDTYHAQILRSILEFKKNNYRLALNIASAASKISNGDGIWRYNKAFLFMRLGKFEDSLRVYGQILKHNFLGEEATLKEVYDFNECYLRNNPDDSWSYFIIGYLKYRKEGEPISSMEYFEKFLKSPNAKKYPPIFEEAEICMKEIDDKEYFPRDN